MWKIMLDQGWNRSFEKDLGLREASRLATPALHYMMSDCSAVVDAVVFSMVTAVCCVMVDSFSSREPVT